MKRERFSLTLSFLVVANVVVVSCATLSPAVKAPSQTKPTIIDAQEFRLVDTEGRVRGALRLDQAGASALILYDKKGRVRAILRVPEDGPSSLLFLDEHGTAQTPRHSLP